MHKGKGGEIFFRKPRIDTLEKRADTWNLFRALKYRWDPVVPAEAHEALVRLGEKSLFDTPYQNSLVFHHFKTAGLDDTLMEIAVETGTEAVLPLFCSAASILKDINYAGGTSTPYNFQLYSFCIETLVRIRNEVPRDEQIAYCENRILEKISADMQQHDTQPEMQEIIRAIMDDVERL